MYAKMKKKKSRKSSFEIQKNKVCGNLKLPEKNHTCYI